LENVCQTETVNLIHNVSDSSIQHIDLEKFENLFLTHLTIDLNDEDNETSNERERRSSNIVKNSLIYYVFSFNS